MPEQLQFWRAVLIGLPIALALWVMLYLAWRML